MSPLSRLTAPAARSIARLPAVAQAAIWSVLASVCTVGFTAIAKHLATDGLPVPMIVFFRSLFGLIFLGPWLMRVGVAGLATARPVLLLGRGINSLLGLYFIFLAAKLLPVADVMAIMFSKPIFAAALAVAALGEVMYRSRWTATLIAAAGMLIIIRPGFADINLGVAFAIGALVCGSYTAISVKLSTRTEPADRIVAYTLGCMMIGSSVPALLVWQTPDWEQLLWLIVLGAFANGFQRAMTRSYAAADATVVMPFEFTRLIVAAVVGYFAFDDVADLWTWIGGGVVFAGSFYMVRIEARRGRRARAAASG